MDKELLTEHLQMAVGKAKGHLGNAVGKMGASNPESSIFKCVDSLLEAARLHALIDLLDNKKRERELGRPVVVAKDEEERIDISTPALSGDAFTALLRKQGALPKSGALVKDEASIAELCTVPPASLYGFWALQQTSGGDSACQAVGVSITPLGMCMALCAPDGPIYVTKAQAMAFFDLEEKVTRSQPSNEVADGWSHVDALVDIYEDGQQHEEDRAYVVGALSAAMAEASTALRAYRGDKVIPPKPPIEPPSYHDVTVYYNNQVRRIFNDGGYLKVICTRVGGWELWDSGGRAHSTDWQLLAGEFHDGKPLCIEVAGRVICGVRP